MSQLWVAVVLGALVLAALRRSGHKKIARWAAVPFVCLCLVLIAIGVHKMMTAQETASTLITPSQGFPSSSSPSCTTSSSQVVLAFTGLSSPYGVAVDSAGAVYVTEDNTNRVLKLPAR